MPENALRRINTTTSQQLIICWWKSRWSKERFLLSMRLNVRMIWQVWWDDNQDLRISKNLMKIWSIWKQIQEWRILRLWFQKIQQRNSAVLYLQRFENQIIKSILQSEEKEIQIYLRWVKRNDEQEVLGDHQWKILSWLNLRLRKWVDLHHLLLPRILNIHWCNSQKWVKHQKESSLILWIKPLKDSTTLSTLQQIQSWLKFRTTINDTHRTESEFKSKI